MKTKLLQIVAAIESVHPIGALVLFLVAYVAFWCGLAAVVIVAAFLVGLHFAKRPAAALVIPATPVVDRVPTPFEQIVGAGLECSKVEFKKPGTQRATQQKQTA